MDDKRQENIALWFPAGYDLKLADTDPPNVLAYINFHNDVALIMNEKISFISKCKRIETLFLQKPRIEIERK